MKGPCTCSFANFVSFLNVPRWNKNYSTVFCIKKIKKKYWGNVRKGSFLLRKGGIFGCWKWGGGGGGGGQVPLLPGFSDFVKAYLSYLVINSNGWKNVFQITSWRNTLSCSFSTYSVFSNIQWLQKWWWMRYHHRRNYCTLYIIRFSFMILHSVLISIYLQVIRAREREKKVFPNLFCGLCRVVQKKRNGILPTICGCNN